MTDNEPHMIKKNIEMTMTPDHKLESDIIANSIQYDE